MHVDSAYNPSSRIANTSDHTQCCRRKNAKKFLNHKCNISKMKDKTQWYKTCCQFFYSDIHIFIFYHLEETGCQIFRISFLLFSSVFLSYFRNKKYIILAWILFISINVLSLQHQILYLSNFPFLNRKMPNTTTFP